MSRLLSLCALLVVAGCGSGSSHLSDSGFNPGSTEAISPRIDEILSTGHLHREVWRLNLSSLSGEATVDRCLQVEGDLLLAQDQANLVHAINVGEGTHRWVVQCDGKLSLPVGRGADHCTMISGTDMVVVDDAQGTRRTQSNAVALSFSPWSNGTDAGDVLFVGCAAPYGVQALHADTGRAGWHYATRAPVSELLTVGSGATAQVVALTEDGLLVSLPPWPAGGPSPTEETWHARLPGTRPAGGLGLAGHRLFVGGEDGFLYCIDARNGAVLWKASCGGEVQGRPATDADAVYAASCAGVSAFALESGAPLWVQEGGERWITRVQDLCYVANEDGAVCVLQAADGVEVARFDGAGLNLPTVPGGGLLVAGDGRGNLFALK